MSTDFESEIRANFAADFAPLSGGHWTEDDRESILEEALRRLRAKAALAGNTDLRTLWPQVVGEFHREQQWGHRPRPGRAPVPMTEERRRRRELWPYIWSFLQATFIMKLVIYYFGVNSADDPSLKNYLGLGLGILASFGSLAFFAWRQHRKEKALEK